MSFIKEKLSNPSFLKKYYGPRNLWMVAVLGLERKVYGVI